jgi:hypothetical protein
MERRYDIKGGASKMNAGPAAHRPLAEVEMYPRAGVLTIFERRFWWIALALIVVMGGVMVASALDESQTWDEAIHSAIGYAYWETGEFYQNVEHPALGKMLLTLPLRLYVHPALNTKSEAYQKQQLENIGIEFLYSNRVSPETILFSCRMVAIAITLALAAYLAWWSRRRFGPVPALVALALFTFDPNFIANGRFVTNDVLAAATIFITCTLWIEYLVSRRRLWLVLTGLSLGVAFASKYSSLYLAGVLPILFWVRPRKQFRFAAREFVVACVTLALLATAVLAVVYSPELIHPNPYTHLRDHLTGRGFAGSVLLSIANRLPFVRPLSWVIGIDRVSEFNSLGRQAYLLGKVSDRGWWYYFPVAFAIKTPIAVLAGFVLSSVLAVIFRRRLRRFGFVLFALLVPAAVFFVISCSASINIGMRHILPIYPALYVFMGCALAEAASATKWAQWALAAVLVLTAAESAAIFPNYLAFFNLAVGGPDAGPKYLLDSNLDWGQSFKKLGRYVKENHIDRTCLWSFGNGSPARYISGHVENMDADHMDRLNCVAAVSATPLFGLYTGPEYFASLRARKPMAIVGHSIYLYDLRKKTAP